MPDGSQAKLAPRAVVDKVLPVLTGRRLATEDGALWGGLKLLFAARDVAVHQGVLPAGANAPRPCWASEAVR